MANQFVPAGYSGPYANVRLITDHANAGNFEEAQKVLNLIIELCSHPQEPEAPTWESIYALLLRAGITADSAAAAAARAMAQGTEATRRAAEEEEPAPSVAEEQPSDHPAGLAGVPASASTLAGGT